MADRNEETRARIVAVPEEIAACADEIAMLAEHVRAQLSTSVVGDAEAAGELARAARQESWGQSAHLIALTGWGQATDKERAMAAGFDRHLVKPVDADILSALLEATLRERRSPARPPQ